MDEFGMIHNQLVEVKSGSRSYGPILRDAADRLVVELAAQGVRNIKVTNAKETNA